MTDQASNEPVGDVFARLATVPVPVMAGYLVNELPQTVAAILLLLPQERAAAIMNGLPPRFFQSVVRRMASSEAMFPAARTIVAKVLEREFLANGVRGTPDRDEEMRRLVALMSPELRDAAMAALEPPAEVPKKPRNPPPAYSWSDFMLLTKELVAERTDDAKELKNPLPLLEPVYDRFVRMLATSMRTVTGLNSEISLDRLSYVQHGDYLNQVPLPAVLVPFIAEGGGYCGLVVASPVLFCEVVDALLGGTIGPGLETLNLYGRPFTTTERSLFELALDSMISDLSTAFDVVGSVAFRLERTETNPRFAIIAPPEALMIQADLSIKFEKGGGRLHLLLLDAALDPFREILSQLVIPPAHQPKPPLVVPTDAGPKLKLATPPAERRNA
jgi:hypothetical protein